MFANTNVQSAPTCIDLASFHGRGEQPRTMFADKVTGHLVSITLRDGEYEVKRNGQPVLDANGKPMVRPNSAIAEWRSDDGQRVLTSWPCRYDDQKQILLWDAFDASINLAIDHLHFEKETTAQGRVFYSLTKVEVQAQAQAAPRAQQFVTAAPAAQAPWEF